MNPYRLVSAAGLISFIATTLLGGAGRVGYAAPPRATLSVAVAVGTHPVGVAFNGQNHTFVVAVQGPVTDEQAPTGRSSLAILDARTSRLEATIPLGLGRHFAAGYYGCSCLAVDPTSGLLYASVTDHGAPALLVIDTRRRSIRATWPYAGPALPIPGHRVVYATTRDGKGTALLDARTGHLLRTIPVAASTVAYAPRQGRVYLGGYDGDVVALDAATGWRVLSIRPPTGPGGISPEPVTALAVDAAAHRLVVLYAQDMGAAIGFGLAFDTATGSAVGGRFNDGAALALDTATHRAVVVALLSSNTSLGPTPIDTIDARAGRLAREEQPESGIHGAATLSVDGIRHRAYVATMRYSVDGEYDTPPTSLYAVDTRTGRVVPGPRLLGGAAPTPAASLDEALDVADGRLAIVVPGDGQVHIIETARL